MGNLLSKVLPLCRRLFRRRSLRDGDGRRNLRARLRPALFPVGSDRGPPERNHPAAPARAVQPGRSHPVPVCLPATPHTQCRRGRLSPHDVYSCLGSLPLVNLKDSPEKPVLPTSGLAGPSETVRIPPPGRKSTLPHSPPEQVVKPVMPGPSSTIPHPGSREREARVQEKPQQGMTENEKCHADTNGQDSQNSQPSSGDLPLNTRPPKTHEAVISDEGGPGPLDGGPKPPECSLSANGPEAPVSSASESQVAATSGSPAGAVPPPPKRDSEAAVLSAPTPCCSVLPERSAKKGVGEEHAQIRPDAHSEQPADTPSVSSPSLVSTGSRPRQFLPRPVSLPLAPLMWDPGQLPVPCLALDRNPDTLKTPTSQQNKIVEDETKVMADSSATQSAPSFTPPGVAADSLPQAAHTGQGPATANSADPSARSPTLSGPIPPLTPNVHQKTGHTIPHFSVPQRACSLLPLSSNHILEISPKNNGGRLYSVIAAVPVSDICIPAMISPSSFQPPSCSSESPTPMCVDSPSPPPVPSGSGVLPLGLPVNSVAVPSTSDNSQVTDMDTTPPSDVFVFAAAPCSIKKSRRPPRAKSPPCCSKRSHRHPRAYCRVENSPNVVASSTGPPAPKYLRLVPCYARGPKTAPQPPSGTCDGQKTKTSVATAAVGCNQAPVTAPVPHAPANSTSANPVDDSEPMDTMPSP